MALIDLCLQPRVLGPCLEAAVVQGQRLRVGVVEHDKGAPSEAPLTDELHVLAAAAELLARVRVRVRARARARVRVIVSRVRGSRTPRRR